MRQIIFEDVLIPTRLDKCFKRMFPSVTNGLMQKFCRSKLIKVNKVSALPSLRITNQDVVEIRHNLIDYLNKNQEIIKKSSNLGSKKTNNHLVNRFKAMIIFENDDLIAIDKPQFLSTQGGYGITESVDHMIDAMNRYEGMDLRLTHRIDRDTSGIVLLARSLYAASCITQAFKDRSILKKYIAVIKGRQENTDGEIKCYLEKYIGKDGVYRVRSTDSESLGKFSHTEYSIIGFYDGNSLCEFTPVTGRMHQIRYHAVRMDSYVIGDARYGPRRRLNNNKHMLLHAYTVVIPKTVLGYQVSIKADIPEYFGIENYL